MRHNGGDVGGQGLHFDEMVQRGQESLTVRRVFGEPYEREGVTIIPAAAIRGGGGGGGGEDAHGNQGGGGGFGMSGRPVGAYVVRGGTVSWVPAVDQTRVIVLGQIAAILLLIMLRTVLRRLVKRR
jgi:uncharacterized spore protein YtfJ